MELMRSEISIGLLGLGTVGTGVVKLLRRHAGNLERRLGAPLELVGIADRSLEPDRSIGITSSLITREISIFELAASFFNPPA